MSSMTTADQGGFSRAVLGAGVRQVGCVIPTKYEKLRAVRYPKWLMNDYI